MIDYIVQKQFDYYQQSTAATPEVRINTHEGIIKISGRSVPENSLAFYAPVYEILKKMKPFYRQFSVLVELEYFNTSSAKCLFDLLKIVSNKQKNGFQANVYWRFEEEDWDMKETGEDYEELLGLAFHYESIPYVEKHSTLVA